jgi:dihydroxyacetone kinase
MSKAHLFDSPDGLVVKSLRGLISYNPSLSLDEANRVVFDTNHDRSKVSIVSGGGSGHEPGNFPATASSNSTSFSFTYY